MIPFLSQKIASMMIFPGDGTGQNLLYSTLKNKICLCQLIWFQAVTNGPITTLLDMLFPEKLDHFCSDLDCWMIFVQLHFLMIHYMFIYCFLLPSPLDNGKTLWMLRYISSPLDFQPTLHRSPLYTIILPCH
jgi:hypothetical protein